MTESEARALLALAIGTDDDELVLKAVGKLERAGFGWLVDQATGQNVDTIR